MRFIVPTILVLVAIIHALPVLGVIGASKLSQLCGHEWRNPGCVE